MPQGMDPSLSLHVGPQGSSMTYNPFKVILDTLQAQHLGNQAKLFQQEYDSRNALGPLMQKSVNTDQNSPEYGNLNVEQFMAGAAQDPKVAWRAPEFVRAALENRQKQIENSQKQLGMAKEKNDYMNTQLGGLVAMGDTITSDNVMEVAANMAADGIVEPKKIAAQLKDMPQSGPALAKWVLQRQLQAAGAAKQLDLQYGKIEQMNLGNKVLIGRVNQLNDTFNPIGEATTGMSPAEAAGLEVTGRDEEGAELRTPKGVIAENTGLARPGTYTGRGATGGTSFTTTLPPADAAYLEGRGKTIAKYAEELDEKVTVGNQLMPRIAEMRDLMKETRTGGGTSAYLSIAKIAQALGFSDKLVDQMAGGSVPAAEEFEKFALQTSTELLRQMLVGSRMTNLEFDQFRKNNPQLNTDPRATENIFNFISKMQATMQQEQKEFQKFTASKARGGEGGKITDWPAEWTKRLTERGIADPRYIKGEALSTMMRGDAKTKTKSLADHLKSQ